MYILKFLYRKRIKKKKHPRNQEAPRSASPLLPIMGDILPDPIPSTIITTTTNVMGDVENDDNHNKNNKNNDNDKNDPPSFLQYFLSSNGPPQLIVAGFILVLASGSCIGVVR